MKSHSLLFLPGLLCTARIFEYQIPRLPDGFSGKGCELPAGETMGEIASRLWEENPGNHILCGLSLGGILCMEMLHLYPERVEGLVLMDTNALDETEEVSRAREGLIARAEETSPGEVAENVLFEKQVHPGLSKDRVLRKTLGTMADAYGVKKLRMHARALAGRSDYSPVLVEVSCPVLILSGEDDFICPEEKQLHLQKLMPGADRVSVSGAGHLSSLERPAAVSEELNRWLARRFG